MKKILLLVILLALWGIIANNAYSQERAECLEFVDSFDMQTAPELHRHRVQLAWQHFDLNYDFYDTTVFTYSMADWYEMDKFFFTYDGIAYHIYTESFVDTNGVPAQTFELVIVRKTKPGSIYNLPNISSRLTILDFARCFN